MTKTTKDTAKAVKLAATGKGKGTAAKARVDWAAIERDFRTGTFTTRELGSKYGVTHSLIARNAKVKGWSQDLALVIKQATNAKLVDELVTKEVHKSAQKVHETIHAAAEVNKRVILAHRTRIAALSDLTDKMTAELVEVTTNLEQLRELFTVLTSDMSDTQLASTQRQFQELMRLPSRIQAAKTLAEAMTKLQTMERTAFGLDEDVDKNPDNSPMARLTDAERAVRLVAMLKDNPEALLALRNV